MRARLLILATLVAAIMLSIILVPVIRAQVTPSESRTSDIRATVLEVERLDFPVARLKLRVTDSARLSTLDVHAAPREITAQNYLWTSGGRVDYQDKRNIDAVAAYYLLQGDEIRGKLFPGSGASDRDGEWFVCGIERLSPGSATGPVRSTNVQGNLRLALEVAESAYDSGRPVRMSLTVENIGTQTETLRFSSGQQYDFTVSSGGREVWRWSAGRAFIQMLTSLTLSPGEKKVFAVSWPQTDNQGAQVKPGEYVMQACLTTAARPDSGRVTVAIRSKR